MTENTERIVKLQYGMEIGYGQEIIRCKDCVYWQDNNGGYPHIGCKWREDETPDPDDFCSAGEQRG